MVVMTTTTPVSDYPQRSARAYELQLRQQLQRYGTPEAAPEAVGRRAAMFVAAGLAWADDVGPFLDTDGVRAALGGVTKQAVSQRMNARRLLGLRLAEDGSGAVRLVYPAWQFRPGILDLLPEVLAAAGYSPGRATTGWTIATWLTTSHPGLGDMTPVQLLAAGRGKQVVVLARQVADSLGVAERAAVASGGT